MELTFELDKETKNFFKYKQRGGINVLYLPKPTEEGVPSITQEFTIQVPKVEIV
jgi:hypothetical protein